MCSHTMPTIHIVLFKTPATYARCLYYTPPPHPPPLALLRCGWNRSTVLLHIDRLHGMHQHRRALLQSTRNSAPLRTAVRQSHVQRPTGGPRCSHNPACRRVSLLHRHPPYDPLSAMPACMPRIHPSSSCICLARGSVVWALLTGDGRHGRMLRFQHPIRIRDVLGPRTLSAGPCPTHDAVTPAP